MCVSETLNLGIVPHCDETSTSSLGERLYDRLVPDSRTRPVDGKWILLTGIFYFEREFLIAEWDMEREGLL